MRKSGAMAVKYAKNVNRLPFAWSSLADDTHEHRPARFCMVCNAIELSLALVSAAETQRGSAKQKTRHPWLHRLGAARTS